MGVVFLTSDSLKPSDHAVEQAYSYGPGPAYGPPVLIDAPGDGQQASLVAASNTAAVFRFNGAYYKLLNRQTPGSLATVICKSTDNGATWAVLDAANSPTTDYGAGYFDLATATVYCAVDAAGSINLRNFDLASETWGALYGVAGAPALHRGRSPTVWKRPNNTLLVMWQNRSAFPPGDPSGLGGVSYDLIGGVWSAIFDVGAGLLSLLGWDSTQTMVTYGGGNPTSVMDSTGAVHVFFNTASIQVAPVFWGNRCFYQQVHLDNSLGSFFDFPGQVAPLYVWNGHPTQDLDVFSGCPLGQPAIVGNTIVLPVINVNKVQFGGDPFPRNLANIYLGTPLAVPVWTKDDTKTIDPGALIDDFIWPQERPFAAFDGSKLWVVFPAQDADGQNFARLRMCQTSNLASLTDGWTAATAFDLQVDPSPPGFQFATQILASPFLLALGAPVITCGGPPDGVTGVAYSHLFPTAGGTPPYAFSIVAGALPTGLTLNSATGVVSGIPTVAGTFPFTVQVVDSLALTGQVACSITILPSLFGLRLVLRGVKRFRKEPQPEPCVCPEPEHVKRAV